MESHGKVMKNESSWPMATLIQLDGILAVSCLLSVMCMCWRNDAYLCACLPLLSPILSTILSMLLYFWTSTVCVFLCFITCVVLLNIVIDTSALQINCYSYYIVWVSSGNWAKWLMHLCPIYCVSARSRPSNKITYRRKRSTVGSREHVSFFFLVKE